MVELDKREFKRRFPNLAEEMELGRGIFQVADGNGVKKAGEDPFKGYVPTIIDYLRQCDNDRQAEQTIDYLEKKGEITVEYADHLRKALKDHGSRSFGPKKQDDYYLTRAGYG